MNVVNRLQAAATRVVELPILTRELREAEALTGEQRILAKIRRVRAGEVAAAVGTVPLLFGLSREKLDSETPEEFAERMRERLLDDPNMQQAAKQQQLSSEAAVVALGVMALGIAEGDAEPEWEPITFDLTGAGEPSVGLLGGSLAAVHNEILALGALNLPRMGDVAGVETFPAEPTSADSEPSGGLLRDDTDSVPEPGAG